MGRRLGPIDHAWLRMERPNNPMTVTGVLTFDEPLDIARLERTIEARIEAFPRLRRRIRTGRGHWARWEDDPGFRVSRHVVHRVLPQPADRRVLRRAIEELVSTPLSMERALWELHALENPNDGRTVLVARFHHCIADGFALMYVMLSLTDDVAEAAVAMRPSPALDTPGPLGRALGSLGREQLVRSVRGVPVVVADLARLATLSNQPPSLLRGSLGTVKRAAWSPPLPLSEVKAIRSEPRRDGERRPDGRRDGRALALPARAGRGPARVRFCGWPSR